jgi:mannose-1-phosphate guanylyltransferase
MTGWDDVGDFSSLADLLPAEANQPRILGDSHLGMLRLIIPGQCVQ